MQSSFTGWWKIDGILDLWTPQFSFCFSCLISTCIHKALGRKVSYVFARCLRKAFFGVNPSVSEPLQSQEKCRLRPVPLCSRQKTSGVGDHTVLFRGQRRLWEPRSHSPECVFMMFSHGRFQRETNGPARLATLLHLASPKSINIYERHREVAAFIIEANGWAQMGAPFGVYWKEVQPLKCFHSGCASEADRF